MHLSGCRFCRNRGVGQRASFTQSQDARRKSDFAHRHHNCLLRDSRTHQQRTLSAIVCAIAAILIASAPPRSGRTLPILASAASGENHGSTAALSLAPQIRAPIASGNSRSVSTSRSHHWHPASRAFINQYNSASKSPANSPPPMRRRQVATKADSCPLVVL